MPVAKPPVKSSLPKEVELRYAIGVALAFLGLGIYVGTKLAASGPVTVAVPKQLCVECQEREKIRSIVPPKEQPSVGEDVTDDTSPDAA